MAQDKPPAVSFHGSNVLLGQVSGRQGTNSEVPEKFLRNDLQMTLTVNNIPLATRFFITTEQSSYNQRIDNLSFYIDLATLKKNKARIEAKNKANNLARQKAPWMLRFLSNFSKIEAGRFRPAYGDLILDGISVSGLNLELTHKVVYAAFATGRVKRAASGDDPQDTTYKQKLLFGKFGFGEKNRTHFYLTYMKIEDEATGPWQGYTFDYESSKPKSNRIFGSDFRLSFIKNKWIIDGDVAVSFMTRDTRIPITYDSIISNNNDVNDPFEYIPEPIIDIIEPNVSTSMDMAYGVSTQLNLRTTTIAGGYRMVGSGYNTLGNSNLINDRQTFDGRIDQAFFKRKVSVSAFYKQFNDNLIDWKQDATFSWKQETTISKTIGVSARFTFNKAPYLQISFTPNRQEINGESLFIKNKMNVFNATTGYNYPLGNIKSFTTLGYLNQNTNYERDTSGRYNKTRTITLNQVLTLNIPLKLNLNASYSDIKQTEYTGNVISVVMSATHRAYQDKWKNTAGVKYKQADTGYDQKKVSLFWDTLFSLWKGVDLGLNVEENFFRNNDSPENDYNEFIAHFKLTLQW